MLYRGVHPLWRNDAFPPCFRFPLFPKNLSDSVENFPDLKIFPTFSEKNVDFHQQNFWWPFFSHRPQILNFPLYFRFFTPFPLFRTNLSFPYFPKFPPWFRKMSVFCTCFLWFSFPPTFTMMHLCITQWTYWTPLMLYTYIFHLTLLTSPHYRVKHKALNFT